MSAMQGDHRGHICSALCPADTGQLVTVITLRSKRGDWHHCTQPALPPTAPTHRGVLALHAGAVEPQGGHPLLEALDI